MIDKVKKLGQVYTPIDIVKYMCSLRKNSGSILEPSCGSGVFSSYIRNNISSDLVSIEIDEENHKEGTIIMDFFDYDSSVKFDTIIGNPPYVSSVNINEETLNSIQNIDYLSEYDNRTNLYVYFIRKSIEQLTENGEIIFITPRDFIKYTSSSKLNNFMYENGTITNWYEYGDKVIFKGYNPNVAIWRYEKNNFSRISLTNDGEKNFDLTNGQLSFIKNDYKLKFNDIFFVKTGAVSGLDKIFTNLNGNTDFVCSYTKRSGELKRMFYNVKSKHLENNKEKLLNRKIKKFNENNWWHWGRGLYESTEDRIYVNCKTRDQKPFFTNDCRYYDGTIFAIFPKWDNIDINRSIEILNNIDWGELGFKVGERLCFTQKSLENTYLPDLEKIDFMNK